MASLIKFRLQYIVAKFYQQASILLRNHKHQSFCANFTFILILGFVYSINTTSLNAQTSPKLGYKVQTIDANKSNSLDTNDTGIAWLICNNNKLNLTFDLKKEFVDVKGIKSHCWKPVQVPGIQSYTDSNTNPKIIWYRKDFLLPSELNKSLSFRAGIINDADRIYLNGKLIASHGDWFSNKPQAYDVIRLMDLPSQLLKQGQINTIHIQVKRTFHNLIGIESDKTAIGPSFILYQEYYLDMISDFFFLGIYIAVGLYFFFLYLSRGKQRENLFFSLFMLTVVYYYFSRNQIRNQLPIDFYLLKKAEYIALFSWGPLFWFFNRFYFRYDSKTILTLRWIGLMSSLAVGVLIGLVVFSSDVNLWYELLVLYFINIVILIGLTFWLQYLAWRKKDPDAIMLFLGIFIWFLATVVDVLVSFSYINFIRISQYAFTVNILAVAFILSNRFTRLHKQAKSQAQSFSRFVPQTFLKLLNRKEFQEVQLGDSSAHNMTILFSDMRAFTSLSEGMSPDDNFKFLNSYLGRMEPIIQKHGGFVDKYIGDAIMSLFTANEKIAPAEGAIETAIQMHQELLKYNLHRQELGFVAVKIGIGIHTGPLMLGTVGSPKRLDTTVIGNTVNLASRLEGLTAIFDLRIIISEKTREAISFTQQELTRYLGHVQVKGKKETIRIYESMAADSEDTLRFKKTQQSDFDSALKLFEQADFESAAATLKGLLSSRPNDGVYKYYLLLCERYMIAPPAHDWRGVIEMLVK